VVHLWWSLPQSVAVSLPRNGSIAAAALPRGRSLAEWEPRNGDSPSVLVARLLSSYSFAGDPALAADRLTRQRMEAWRSWWNCGGSQLIVAAGLQSAVVSPPALAASGPVADVALRSPGAVDPTPVSHSVAHVAAFACSPLLTVTPPLKSVQTLTPSGTSLAIDSHTSHLNCYGKVSAHVLAHSLPSPSWV